VSMVPEVTLNNGVGVPQLGFGVYKVPPAETVAITVQALETGYRHIDTADMYRNEKEVGEAIRRSGVPRDEVFVTSKLNNPYHAYDDALAAFDRSLDALGFDYLDLYLIHWPLPKVGDYVDTWRALEEIHRSGRARAIGVSNFQIHHLERVLDQAETVPAVNQIEAHPYLTQDAVRAFDAEHGIATEVWSPLARGAVVKDGTVQAVAERIGRTPAQVVIRWHLQRGDIVFPKSATPERVRENFEVFDFELTGPDMAAITGLNRDERRGSDPDQNNSTAP
jgi:2,5-diketo-D-gluconate reductase A